MTPSSPKPDEIARVADYDDRYDDDHECWQCGGEGFVTGCSWDWQCDTWDEGEGTCLCTRRCNICNPPPRDPALDKVLSHLLSTGADHDR